VERQPRRHHRSQKPWVPSVRFNPLEVDTPIYLGDVMETGPNASVGLIFIDNTTFSLGEEARMVIDDLIYDPDTGVGSMGISVLQGVFVFVTGEIAASGPNAMVVTTPVSVIGIRGTKVAGKAAQEGEENIVSLLVEDDGGIGVITVSTDIGQITLDASNYLDNAVIVSSARAVPQLDTFTASQFDNTFGDTVRVNESAVRVMQERRQQEESEQQDGGGQQGGEPGAAEPEDAASSPQGEPAAPEAEVVVVVGEFESDIIAIDDGDLADKPPQEQLALGDSPGPKPGEGPVVSGPPRLITDNEIDFVPIDESINIIDISIVDPPIVEDPLATGGITLTGSEAADTLTGGIGDDQLLPALRRRRQRRSERRRRRRSAFRQGRRRHSGRRVGRGQRSSRRQHWNRYDHLRQRNERGHDQSFERHRIRCRNRQR
jgi:hypothetical protein